jgi:glutamate-1-semialdehyde aminotransferase
VGEVVLLPYGTQESLEVIERLGKDLAAVLIEPVQSRRPELQPVAFVKRVRELTEASGTALILDEVVTGFRCHPGGVQALWDVRADLATYGKVVAGGYPVGLVAGRAKYLDALDGGYWQFGDESVPEVGVTFFAGTFVRHPVALAAMKAVLTRIAEAGPALQAGLAARASALVSDLKAFLARLGVRIQIECFTSIMYVSVAPGESWSSLLWARLRHEGLHIWEHFPCFLTTAHTDEDIARFKATFCRVVTELAELGFLTRTGPAGTPSGGQNGHAGGHVPRATPAMIDAAQADGVQLAGSSPA